MQTNQIVITYPRSNDVGLIIVTIAFRTEDFNNITVNQLQQILEQQKQNLNHLTSECLKSIQSNIVLDGIL